MDTGKGQSFILGQMAIKRWSEHRNPKSKPGFLQDGWSGLKLLYYFVFWLSFPRGEGGGTQAP